LHQAINRYDQSQRPCSLRFFPRSNKGAPIAPLTIDGENRLAPTPCKQPVRADADEAGIVAQAQVCYPMQVIDPAPKMTLS
jgi:hypothetical protein